MMPSHFQISIDPGLFHVKREETNMQERGVNGFSITIHGAAKFRLCVNLFYLPEKLRQCKEYENLSTNDISNRYFSKFYWEQYEKKTTTKFGVSGMLFHHKTENSQWQKSP